MTPRAPAALASREPKLLSLAPLRERRCCARHTCGPPWGCQGPAAGECGHGLGVRGVHDASVFIALTCPFSVNALNDHNTLWMVRQWPSGPGADSETLVSKSIPRRSSFLVQRFVCPVSPEVGCQAATDAVTLLCFHVLPCGAEAEPHGESQRRAWREGLPSSGLT